MNHLIEGKYGSWFDSVTLDGVALDPRPSLRLANHSPDGFAWGYGGSGPAQLALAILLAAGASSGTALARYQQFKAEFLVGLPQRGDFRLSLDIDAWLKS